MKQFSTPLNPEKNSYKKEDDIQRRDVLKKPRQEVVNRILDFARAYEVMRISAGEKGILIN